MVPMNRFHKKYTWKLCWSTEDEESANLWEMNCSRCAFLVICSLASYSTKKNYLPGGPEQAQPNYNQSYFKSFLLHNFFKLTVHPFHFPKFRKDCFSIRLNQIKLFISIFFKIDFKIMLDFFTVLTIDRRFFFVNLPRIFLRKPWFSQAKRKLS